MVVRVFARGLSNCSAVGDLAETGVSVIAKVAMADDQYVGEVNARV